MFCGNCGKQIEDGLTQCPECGAQLVPADALREDAVQADVQQAPPADALREDAVQADAQQASPADAAREDSPAADSEVHAFGGAQAAAPPPVQEAGADEARRETQRVRKKLPGKRLLLALAAGCALLLICIIAFFVFRLIGQGPDRNYVMLAKNAWEVRPLTGGESLVFSVDGTQTLTLPDITVMSVSNREGNVMGAQLKNGGLLYHVAGGKETFIEEDVSRFFFSRDGDSLAFCVGKYEESETNTLDLYIRKGGKNERISRDFARYAAFSPNGRYLLFTEYDGRNYNLLLYDGRNTQELESSKRPLSALSVTNNAGIICYCVQESDGTNILYRSDGKKREELGALGSGTGHMFFNADCTEIFFTEGGNAYYVKENAEPLKLRVNGEVMDFVVPPGTVTSYQYNYGVAPAVMGIVSFENTLLISDGTIFRFNGETLETVARRADKAVLSADGRQVVYTKSKGLYRISAKKEAEEEEITGDEVVHFQISSDGKTVVYATKEYALYCAKGKKEPQLIADKGRIQLSETHLVSSNYRYYSGFGHPLSGEVNNAGGSFARHEKTDRLYYVSEGVLYVSEKGKEAVPFEGIGEGVFSIRAVTAGKEQYLLAEAAAGGEGAVYLSTDGKAFTLLSEELVPPPGH